MKPYNLYVATGKVRCRYERGKYVIIKFRARRPRTAFYQRRFAVLLFVDKKRSWNNSGELPSSLARQNTLFQHLNLKSHVRTNDLSFSAAKYRDNNVLAEENLHMSVNS